MNGRLLRQAKRGNADAFIALCAPFEGMVYRHCLQLLKNPADAQDAALEAMLRAFRAFQTFEERSELGTWLFKIAHNVSLDILKRAHRRRECAYSWRASSSGQRRRSSAYLSGAGRITLDGRSTTTPPQLTCS